jgi:hypothetical protein
MTTKPIGMKEPFVKFECSRCLSKQCGYLDTSGLEQSGNPAYQGWNAVKIPFMGFTGIGNLAFC